MASIIAAIERVDRVSESDRLAHFTVTATTAERCWQFQTFSMWLASLCQAAHESQQYVELEYKDGLLSRWGKRWTPRLLNAYVVPPRSLSHG